MPNLLRLSALLLTLCLSAPISYAQDNNEPPLNAPTPITTEDDKRPPEANHSEIEQEDSGKDIGAVSDSLSIEERMANIADEGNDLAFIQVIIGVCGLFLLLLTTLFALGAWLSARKGVTVTEKIGKKQTKAYLSIESLRFNTETKSGFPTIDVNIRNTGQSPANNVSIKDVSYTIDLAVTDLSGSTPIPELKTFSDAIGVDRIMFVPDIMSGETKELEDQIICGTTQPSNSSIINDAIVFCGSGMVNLGKVEVFLNIEYEDVFGDKFEIPYCFWADVKDTLNNLKFNIIRNRSVSNIREFAKFHAGNNAENHIDKIRVTKHQTSPDAGASDT